MGNTITLCWLVLNIGFWAQFVRDIAENKFSVERRSEQPVLSLNNDNVMTNDSVAIFLSLY